MGELNRRARALLEGHFPAVWVQGEISNLSRPSSGHWYFSLKDAEGQIRCAMFRGNNQRVRTPPKDGQRVMLQGRLSLFEARGDYQLIVEHMEDAGQGELQRAFEQLKAKLQAEGLFEASRKQALPDTPRHLAVITSPTGAAIHDILHVLERRCPLLPVTLLPVPVQGQEAPPAIIQALARINRLAERLEPPVDVIVLGRGGGSAEDLWAFNDEGVARAIAASRLPVVSAVGHEIDFTIADFVADLRAPTPSAAAELVSPDQQHWLARLRAADAAMLKELRASLAWHRQRLDGLNRRLRHPGQRLREQAQRLDYLELRLQRIIQQKLSQHSERLSRLDASLHLNSPSQRLSNLRQRLEQLPQRLQRAQQQQLAARGQQLRQLHALLSRSQPGPRLLALRQRIEQLAARQQRGVEQRLNQQRQRLAVAIQLLNTVSPLATLERGYAIVSDGKGRILHDAASLSAGDALRARLARGEVICTVNHIELDENTP